MGRRPLPRVLRERPFVLILGPVGVGKTSVVQRLFGDDAVTMRGEDLHEASVRAVRSQRWPRSIREAPLLVLDGPTYLNRRPGVTRLLSGLIRDRAAAGHRTAVCQGSGDASATLLLDAVAPEQRATLTLRFPIGTGRERFARRICDERGWPRTIARGLEVEPWTYARVIAELEARAAAERCGEG